MFDYLAANPRAALVFHWDPSLEYGERIDQLLDELGLGRENSDEAP